MIALPTQKKGQLFDRDNAHNLSYGNFNEDLSENSDSDLFIEAVSEKLDIKHNLWSKVAKIAKPSAILASNTSGIPIEKIASVLDDEAAGRFVGLHFFNPPRFMKLVEIIPHSKTSKETVAKLEEFSTHTLGKGVVHAKDVSGFVANRIGVYALVDVMKRAEEKGYNPVEVDAMTGPVIGRPKTATYRLADLVGVDIAYHVASGMLANPEEKDFYVLPESTKILMDKGYLGNKTKQGYYKREGKQFFYYDSKNDQYLPSEKPQIPFLKELGRNLKENLATIFEAEDEDGQFIWESLENVLYFL